MKPSRTSRTLQEIPLLDRKFTWSNMQQPPILSKLDRILINYHWGASLPNTTIMSLPRTTSDHFPIKIEISTNIPIPQIFRYCNDWKHKLGFKDLVCSAWSNSPHQSDAAGTLVAKLKTRRKNAKEWKKSLKPDRVYLERAKRTLDLMDWMEENRPLSQLEGSFRRML